MHLPTKKLRTLRACARPTALAFAVLCAFAPCGLSLAPGKNLRQYVLRTWMSAQGLPQDSIHAMLQTRDGFLWIGTQGGLARFDGAAFVVWKPGAANSIPGESITGLAEDLDGSVWIGSNGGLTRYRDGRFHTFTSRDGLPDSSIWRIAADRRGGVWAVTWRSELFHFDGKRVHRCESSFAGRTQDVNALLEDPGGTLWVATFHGLFSVRDHRVLRRYGREDGLPSDRVYALALDRGGRLWSAGDGGLAHTSPGGFVPIAVPHLAVATLLAFDPTGADDAVWTGATGQGLFRLNRKGVERLRETEGLISDEQYLLYFSRDGSLWLGARNGLNQLSDGAVTSFSGAQGVPRSTAAMQRVQGPSDELWFGQHRFFSHVRDGALAPLGSPPPGARASRSGRKTDQLWLRSLNAVPLWARSNDPGSRGLVLSDLHGRSLVTDGTMKRALPAIPWSSVGSMLIARDRTIWTAGSEIGVVAYPMRGAPRAYTTADGLDDNNVLDLAEDMAGNVWVGTISGLNRIHAGVVTRVLGCADVNSISPSADGSVWAGSNSGLIYVPPALGSFPAVGPTRIFTQRDNLPTSLIDGVAEDTLGDLWLGTEQGIVRVRKADLLAGAERPQSAPIVFGEGDGLRSAQLRINSVFRSRHGDIWFLTMGELAVIDPRRIQSKPLAPVAIERIEIDGRDAAAAPGMPLVIPAGRHRLTIRYTLPEFRFPGRIRFRYRLEGWDKGWAEAGGLREATYTGIPPGRYTFQVVNSDGYGSWSPEGSALPVKVEPHFYETAWCLTLAALLVAAGISQMHRLRIAQVRARMDARMQERTRIARELHDTLLQGVLGVSMQMYAASNQDAAPGTLTSTLSHASQRLREIAEQSRRAVEGLRSPSPSPDSLEGALAIALREMDLPAGLQPRTYSAGAPAALRPAAKIELVLITREAVANAVRHSGADLIRVDILYQSGHFFLSVSDNGRGIDPDAQESGHLGHWGIAGMRERAELIGACLRILPNKPRGTVVEISLAGSDAYFRAPRGRRERQEAASHPDLL